MPNGYGMIYIHSMRTGRNFAVSDGLHDDREPRWDPAGKYLYLLSRRHLNPILGELDFEHVYVKTTQLYAVALATETPPPLPGVARTVEFDLDAWAKPPEPSEDDQDANADDPDSMVVDTEGLTLIASPFLDPTGRSAEEHPLSAGRKMAETTTLFDDVLVPADELVDELARFGPAEILVPEHEIDQAPALFKDIRETLGVAVTPRAAHAFDAHLAERALCEHFGVSSLAGFGFDKFDASSWDAIVLATAGLVRLGLEERIGALIPIEEMIPAVGQGALAIETRTDDRDVLTAVARLNHVESERAVACERAFLGRLEGGCQVPIGAYADADGDRLRLRGYVGSVDGTRHLRREAMGDAAEALGLALAEEMLEMGAAEIIRDVAEVDD